MEEGGAVNRQLSMAYSVCRGVARSQAKNFYYAFLALPRDKRNALCAVYAFMRHADDLSDSPGLSPQQRQQQLSAWAVALREAVGGKSTDDPVILALADTQRRFHVPVDLFDQLVYGTTLDVEGQDAPPGERPRVLYQTFDELYRYCYFVASVVGLVCIHIFGYKDKAAEKLAEETGIAFQLTNIIRDVKEDALMGRIYLPADDLNQFNIAQDALDAGKLRNGFQPGAFSPLLDFEAQRARQYYKAAEQLIPLVDEDSRPCLWALTEIYQRLLNKITASQYNVFGPKIRLTVPEKLAVLSRSLAKVVF
jgi:phytoene synthase